MFGEARSIGNPMRDASHSARARPRRFPAIAVPGSALSTMHERDAPNASAAHPLDTRAFRTAPGSGAMVSGFEGGVVRINAHRAVHLTPRITL